MLSLQEVESPPDRDRRAKRQGQSLIEVLTELQRALLAEDSGGEALNRLADQARSMPVAADPALRAITDAIVLRAEVELARAEMQSPAAGRHP